jgi:1-deoxy-D-xylulose-5-phosphate reductoisomerase
VAEACDWTTATTWEFFPLDDSAFPAVRLARQAGEFGKTAPAVLNAANEVCVGAFAAGDLDFLGIVDTVGVVLEEHTSDPDVAHEDLTLASVLEADARARERARALVDAR